MDNALGTPQTILVLGGSSEIGLAMVRALCGPHTRFVMLACRDVVAGERLIVDLAPLAPQATFLVTEFEATATNRHQEVVASAVAAMGDLDLVLHAVGQLGDQHTLENDPAAAAALWQANATGAVSIGLAVAAQLRAQAHGTFAVISSVAGERVRRSNFIYGSSKAAMDAFFQGLADALIGTGARVIILRPGFVHTRMTAGMKAAPFATTPEKVAAALVAGLRSNSRIIWVPGVLRWVFMVLRHLPGPIWRRLPL
jgi:decaprenylphospho-beta-D-erythro-pentofuranosid-2-ulose 2-reductase